MKNQYVCHSGVKGMKWGVRKEYDKNQMAKDTRLLNNGFYNYISPIPADKLKPAGKKLMICEIGIFFFIIELIADYRRSYRCKMNPDLMPDTFCYGDIEQPVTGVKLPFFPAGFGTLRPSLAPFVGQSDHS